ncbi:hypothetical protein FALBO_15436 [Fusarium albosuccineum]|uniref:Uncharacterized protein n=1 Tax=Fusarium albosuccineum TaxID=1237068 RepID=A0A8H4KUD1_9HYPO|nr:hypothetical protein FALBO_15436 [Fusarium albosuccineum]
MTGTESAASNAGGFDLLRRATQAMMSSASLASEPKPCGSPNKKSGRPERLELLGAQLLDSRPALQNEVLALKGAAGCKALVDRHRAWVHHGSTIPSDHAASCLNSLAKPGKRGQHSESRSWNRAEEQRSCCKHAYANQGVAMASPWPSQWNRALAVVSKPLGPVRNLTWAPAPNNGPGGIPTCKRQLVCLCRPAFGVSPCVLPPNPAINQLSRPRLLRGSHARDRSQPLLPSVRQALTSPPRSHSQGAFFSGAKRGKNDLVIPFPFIQVSKASTSSPHASSYTAALGKASIFITAGPGALPTSTPERTHHWPS